MLRFGEFEIDTDALELRRGGEPVPVPPQAVRALILLVRNAGRLVTREELYAELWPEPDIDVDRGLNTLIRHIRIGLGDSASDPKFVRTYPRRGYRFVAPSAPAAPLSGTGASRFRGAAVLSVLAVIAGLAVWLAHGSYAGSPEQGRTESLSGDGSGSGPRAADLDPAIRTRYLEGLYLVEQADPRRRGEAITVFEEVTAAAPDFAPAHAGLAEASFWAGRPDAAREAAERALDLDATQVRALIVRGTVRLFRDWDREAADADLEEAVRLAPDEPEPHHALAFAQATAGRHEEAVRELETAFRLDPVSSVVAGDLGLIHLYAGNLDQAADYCARALSLEPDAAWAVECAFDALVQMDRFAAALPYARTMVERAGESAGVVLGGAEPDAAVRRFLVWRADRAGREPQWGGSAWGAALALASAGRRAQAIRALEQAAGERGIGFVTITIDPRFRTLWSEPAFRALAGDLAEHGFAPLQS